MLLMAGASELEDLRRNALDEPDTKRQKGIKEDRERNRKLTTKEIKQMSPEAYQRYIDAQMGAEMFGRVL